MMDDYSQPDFYRFNQDSLQLVKWILKNISSTESILDLGAGSGIIGIELAREFRPLRLTLVEVQEEFKVHLKQNVQGFVPMETKSTIKIESFSQFSPNQKFDLIVCNPPYYLPGAGQLPLDPQRAKARSFIIDSWDILMKCFKESLSTKGEGFIVLKKDDGLYKTVEEHGRFNQLQLQRIIEGNLMFIKVTTI